MEVILVEFELAYLLMNKHYSHFVQASFIGAIAIADLVKTTLGPKGMVTLFLPEFPANQK